MSNFYPRQLPFSPAAEAVLDEPVVGTAPAKTVTHEAPGAVHKATSNYALFHYALLVYIYLFCTRLPELFPAIRLALAMSVIMVAGLLATGPRRHNFFRLGWVGISDRVCGLGPPYACPPAFGSAAGFDVPTRVSRASRCCS